MPQYVIDTLKPKNNNNFPVAEAVDVLYEEGSTVKDKIIAINALIVAAQQLIEGIQTDISELQSGKVDKVSGKGLSTNDFTNTYKSKVDNTYTKTETDTALAGKVDKVSGKGLSTNDFTNTYKSKVDNTYTKTETDSAIANKIAEVVAEAPESFDTLKEIADWIDTHADSASAMNSAIQANTANIEKKVDKVEGKTLSSNDFTDVYKNKVDNTYIKAEIDSKLKDKVDKVSGKGLSTNDFTDEYQTRVHDAYANTIENASEIEKLKSSKADKTALSETNQTVENNRANLQGQIDVLVVEAGGDSNPEVVQARVGLDGTTYETLKSRLDADLEIKTNQVDFESVSERVTILESNTAENIVDIFDSISWENGGIYGDGYTPSENINAIRSLNLMLDKPIYLAMKQIEGVIVNAYSVVDETITQILNDFTIPTKSNGVIIYPLASGYYNISLQFSDRTTITVDEARNIIRMETENQVGIIGSKALYHYKLDIPWYAGTIDANGANQWESKCIRTGAFYNVPDNCVLEVKFNKNVTFVVVEYDDNYTMTNRTSFVYRQTTYNLVGGKKYRFMMFDASGNPSTDDFEAYITSESYYNNVTKPKIEEIPYTLVQKAFDGGGNYVDNDLTVAVSSGIKTTVGERYRIEVSEGFVLVFLAKTTETGSGTIKIESRMLEFEAWGETTYLGVQRADKTELSVDAIEEIGLKIYHVIKRNDSGTYDMIVAASDSNKHDKEIADLICDGINDEIEIECAVNCNSFNTRAARVLLCPGTYYIDKFTPAKNENNETTGIGHNAVCVKKPNPNIYHKGRYSVTIEGRTPGHFAKNSDTKIIVSENCYNSLENDKTKEYAIFGALRKGSTAMGSQFDIFDFNIKNVFICTGGYEKPIIAIDGVGFSQLGVDNVGISWNSDVDVNDIVLPLDINVPVEGLIGIRGVYGSNRGKKNYIKRSLICGMHEGLAVTGEHFIIEDVLMHHCYYGFTVGNYDVRTKMEHPNVFIGCSVEQCYRFALLNRYGATEESTAEKPEQTIIYIGGSVENAWTDSNGNLVGMKPIKEVIKGAYRGRFESDYSRVNPMFEQDGSGKNIDIVMTSYFEENIE